MSNRTKRTKNELERLRLPELQARFREVVGETSRSPNRKFLTRRIEEALAARAAQEAAPATSRRTVAQRAPEPASAEARVDEPTTESNASTPHQRGRFVSMSVEELQAKYLEVVGRATGSDDRRYVELPDMWSRERNAACAPREATKCTPHIREAVGGRMTLRFPRPDACMATSAGSWRSEGDRA